MYKKPSRHAFIPVALAGCLALPALGLPVQAKGEPPQAQPSSENWDDNDDLFAAVAKQVPGFGGMYIDEEADKMYVYMRDGDPDAVGPDCTVQPPSPAASAGYIKLAFCEDFNSTAGIDMNDTGAPGFNFYRRLPFGYPTLPADRIQVANGVLTLNSQVGPNMGLVSIAPSNGGWTGFAPTGGAYFEAAIKFDPNRSGAPGWPSFWTMAAEHLYGTGDPFVEVDFMEWMHFAFGTPANVYAGSMELWNGGMQRLSDNWYEHYIDTGSSDHWGNSWNMIGCLWVPGGNISMFFNNKITTADNAYSELPALHNAADNDHWPVILGSDGYPMQVDWVRVWTK